MDGVVSVAGGRLRGVWRGDHWSFSGIPYGRAPTGPRRWLPPQTPDSWVGVRDSSAFGPIAPQPPAMPGLTSTSDPGGSEPQDEDCLSLNVWTPALPEEPAGTRSGRPVMVWIHGGGFTSGSGSVFLYRGGNLVRNGDAVVVTINYRLGALGFLGLPGPDGLMGNWGLHDQVAALRWVHDNIAAFGGDPENVTVFGESAGAISLVALLTAPSAARLFRRAIVQSGGAHVHDREQAARAASRLAAVLGLATFDREALIRIPAADLVAATTELGGRRPDPGLLPLPFLPVVDGSFLPRHPLEAVASGAASSVDLVVGTNRDELTLFALGNPALSGLDEDGVRAWVANALPGVGRGGGGVVVPGRPGSPARADHAQRHLGRGRKRHRLPLAQPAVGRRAPRGAPSSISSSGRRRLSAAHSARATRSSCPSSSARCTSRPYRCSPARGPRSRCSPDQMQAAWLSFARGGNPSHEGIGEWPAWEREGRTTMVFGPRTGAVPRPRDAELGCWSTSARCPEQRATPAPGEAADGGSRCGGCSASTPVRPARLNDRRREHLLQGDADLEAGQVRARGRSGRRGRMRGGVRIHARGGIGPGPRSGKVAVGRPLPHHHLLARQDRAGPPARSFGRRPPFRGRRRRPPQDLFDGGLDRDGPAAEELELFRPLDEGQDRTGDGVARRLRAGGEIKEKKAESSSSLSARRVGPASSAWTTTESMSRPG